VCPAFPKVRYCKPDAKSKPALEAMFSTGTHQEVQGTTLSHQLPTSSSRAGCRAVGWGFWWRLETPEKQWGKWAHQAGSTLDPSCLAPEVHAAGKQEIWV